VLEAKEGAGCGGGHHRHEVSTSCRSTTLDGLQRPRKQIKTILRYYMWKRMEYNKITFFTYSRGPILTGHIIAHSLKRQNNRLLNG
jgi:hypothetical protein